MARRVNLINSRTAFSMWRSKAIKYDRYVREMRVTLRHVVTFNRDRDVASALMKWRNFNRD
jgi:hypothetical protein